MKKVFISLPMAGRTDDEIREELEKAKDDYYRMHLWDEIGAGEVVKFVDTMDNPGPRPSIPEERYGVWYLGCSLEVLAGCDEAFFYGEWKDARGCQIEHKVCKLYGIPILEI